MRRYMIMCLLLISGCQNEFPEAPQAEVIQTGSADLSRSVVLGGSFSSGFMDGALYENGQINSFLNIFFNQLSDSIKFNQPLYDSDNGFNGSSDNSASGRMVLDFIDSLDFPVRQVLNADLGPLASRVTPEELNDFSIPNLRITDVQDASLNSRNPFFERINSDSQSLLDILIGQNPSFIFLHLGWDDILFFASEGASGNISPTVSALNDATDPDVFRVELFQIVECLLQETSAQIVLINIPDLTEFPFFNLIDWYMEDLPPFEVLQEYESFNQQIVQFNINNPDGITRPVLDFDSQGGNEFRRWTILDDNLPDAEINGETLPKIRQVELADFPIIGEKILLPVRETNEFRLGVFPVPDELVLTFSEEDSVRSLIDQYNTTIANVASISERVRVFELEMILRDLFESDLILDGVLFSMDLGVSTIFSSDAIHLNPRGHAVTANELIRFFNTEYGANISETDPNSFRGNLFSEGDN